MMPPTITAPIRPPNTASPPSRVEDRLDVAAVVVPVQNDVIRPRTDHGADDAADDRIHGTVGIQPDTPHIAECHEHRQQQADDDDDAVPLHLKIADGEGRGTDMHINAQIREDDLIRIQIGIAKFC